jgi:heptosyltransferase I
MARFLSLIGWMVINCLGRTLRFRAVNPPASSNVLFAFWHGEQFIPFFRHRNQGVAVMSSLSKDGEIQSGILKLFGCEVVRGSSSRRGDRALVELIRLVKKGHSAGFAADGPKGPYHKVKPGIIYTARKTGRPVIPIAGASERRKILEKAWDKYRLPLPFSRAVIMYGEPMLFSEDEPIEKQAAALEGAMEKLSTFAEGAYWSPDAAEYLAKHPRPKILIVQPSRIGDVIFTLPALAALRKKYPRAWIGWAVDERCAPVLEANNFLDEVIVLDRPKYSIPYLLKMRKYLRSKDIDLSIDFHGLLKSALIVKLAGAKFRLASSSTNGMREFSWLFSKEIKPASADTHCVERHLAVARYLGCDVSRERLRYPFTVTEEEKKSAAEKLLAKGVNLSKPIALMHPGGGWIARRWFPERFAALADRLSAELGMQAALIGGREGGSSEKGINEEIRAAAKHPLIDLTGELTLKELAAVIQRASVYIGNEAGPMHLAVALGAPVVAIIGPTIPGRTGPFGGNTRIIRKETGCAPCRKRDCEERDCMKNITVDEVFSAAKGLAR